MANKKKGKIILHVDNRDQVAFIEVKVGKKTKRFYRREYSDGETMTTSISAWIKGQGVTSLTSQKRVLTFKELLEEAIGQQMTFASLIATIADEAEGLETWDDFDTDVLPDLAFIEDVHLGYVESVFSKIKRAFTPTKFCELAKTEDDPQYYSFDQNKSKNGGFGKIKDAVFGKRSVKLSPDKP